ncbi:hypothetical protein A2801_04010 [Candidatus Woesebacteria bacterium RIFCSPHIGHO2_01_FULL_41_10]|uniref:Uncharacterized protein n=1 Tax=Candidatus Woesebacteria bacterium RIFCSPHIGHO2_01_FULL_41_10 TaxID=1802500 RepID=A0A1F7YPA7_9BACT|nr:MAG: hypothetical protein A2801_04010 [Candidatus Woesebacteria bacterium RIFCSPHIGHO2_01_FULL_41_10]
MSEKVIGYALLLSGLFVVIFAGISVYQVLTGKTEPAPLFSFGAVELSLDSIVAPENREALKQLAGSDEIPKTELVSAELINDTTNVFAHVILMGFLVSIGGRIAGIGTNLLRPIIVKAPGMKLISQHEEKKG